MAPHARFQKLMHRDLPDFKIVAGDNIADISLALRDIAYHCGAQSTNEPGCAQWVNDGETLLNIKTDKSFDKFFAPGTDHELLAAELGAGNLHCVIVQDQDGRWNDGEVAIVVTRTTSTHKRQKWHLWNPIWEDQEYNFDAEYVERAMPKVSFTGPWMTLRVDPEKLKSMLCPRQSDNHQLPYSYMRRPIPDLSSNEDELSEEKEDEQPVGSLQPPMHSAPHAQQNDLFPAETPKSQNDMVSMTDITGRLLVNALRTLAQAYCQTNDLKLPTWPEDLDED